MFNIMRIGDTRMFYKRHKRWTVEFVKRKLDELAILNVANLYKVNLESGGDPPNNNMNLSHKKKN